MKSQHTVHPCIHQIFQGVSLIVYVLKTHVELRNMCMDSGPHYRTFVSVTLRAARSCCSNFGRLHRLGYMPRYYAGGP